MNKEKSNNISEISARIAEVLSYSGETRNSFALKLGYERAQTVYDILNGKSAPSYDFFKKFQYSEYSAIIDIDWLLTGRGKMLKNPNVYKDEQNKESIAHLDNLHSSKGIPLIPLEAMAGFGTDNSAQVMEYESEKYFVPDFKGAEFLIQVKGSSMYPKYSSGDIVACKKLSINTFFQWNKVYVIDSEQGVLIKRVKPGKDKDHILLISENERYDPFEIHKQDIHSLAIVIGVIRLE